MQNIRPLFDAGDPTAMLASMAKRVDLIRQSANEQTRSEFARKWTTVLENCGGWFSSLPLAPDLYREPGGAFRATIETAFYAMRLAGGQKFGANLPSERRRKLEPQYVYALFLAAACSKLDEPYRHFQVLRERDGAEWQPISHGPMSAWLNGSRYELRRRPTALAIERMRTGMLTQIVVGPELLSELEPEVQAELFGAINPSMQPQPNEGMIHKVLRKAVTVAVDFDRKAQAAQFAPIDVDVPPASAVAAQVAGNGEGAAPAATNPGASMVGEMNAVASQSTVVLDGVAASPGAQTPPTLPSDEATSTVTGLDGAALDELLRGAPDMIKDFFRALHEDAASGKAKLVWSEKGLVLPKRLIGGYGVSSETLIDHLRKRSLVVGNSASEVVLAPKAGTLILVQPSA